MMWSEVVGSNTNNKVIYKCFSVSPIPCSVENYAGDISNFSTSKNFNELEVFTFNNFSLLERIRYSKMTPRQILKRRLLEVIRYMKSVSPSAIKDNAEVIKTYLSEYIYQTILNLINTDRNINLIITLGLPSILKKMNTVQKLRQVLIQARKEFNSKGYFSPFIQKKMNNLYNEFWMEFLHAIEDRYFPTDTEKRGILTGDTKDPSRISVTESEDELEPVEAAFSTENESITAILDKLLEPNQSLSEESNSLLNYDEFFNSLDNYQGDISKIENIYDDSTLTALIIAYLQNKDRVPLINYITGLVEMKTKSLDSVFSELSNVEEVDESESTDVPTKVDDFTEKSVKIGGVNYHCFAMRDGSNYRIRAYKLPHGETSVDYSKLANYSVKSFTTDDLGNIVNLIRS